MSKLKDEYSCSLLLTIDLIGGKWKMRLLWHIMYGDNRYSLLRRAIPEITEKMLNTQLRELKSIIDTLCDFTKEYGQMNNILVHE